MPRVTYRVGSKKRRKRMFKQVKGFRGGRRKLVRTAQESLNKSLAYATRDRKTKKRTIRRLWIVRLNAACRLLDISYSKCMSGLKKSNIEINRKLLSNIAISDFETFTEIVEIAKKAA